MPDGQVLEFTHVTKRFNEVTAVSDLSARVEPGAVTAFLGPNGAGKTTTLRILLGQVRATSGTATIGGTAYAELRQPLRTIGSVLEETVYRPRRTASRQLTIAAKANGIPLARVDEVLALVGLDGEADSRIGGFSLGMRQRLSVAHALLGDPGALVFDEPANGLDPEGIRWMRLLMRRLADEGRTVLVSSHVLSEVEQVADNVLVLSKGQLVLSSGIEKLADPTAGSVVVDAADRAALTAALSASGFDVEVLRSGLTVRGGDAGTVGAVAAAAGIALSTLVQRGPTLEDVFIELVRGGKLEARASAAASQLALAPTFAAAEVASVSAAVSEAAPSDPTAAAAIAAGVDPTHDEQGPEQQVLSEAVDAQDGETPEVEAQEVEAPDVTAEDRSEEDAIAVAAVDEVATSVLASENAQHSPVEAEESPVDAPAPSFDQILFGTAAPAAPSSESDDEPTHDVGQILGDRADDENSSGQEEDSADAPHAAPETETSEQDADDSSGIEIFDDLGTDEQSPDEHSDDDPRSAAVSSMLAAAARAYYEDEPKDYPLGSDEVTDEAADDETPAGAEEATSWSVASTGVIDTVPVTASEADDTADADQPADNENDEGGNEHHDGEHHDGEHHDGEHRHD